MTVIKKCWKPLLLVFLMLALVSGIVAWYKFFREIEQEFANEEEHFNYGSLNAEWAQGIPYPLFVALPRVFPDLLPGTGGYRSFGFPWEEGKALPAGFSLKTVGFPRVTQNCALCHTASYRETEDQVPVLVTGGPGHTVRLQAFFRFMFAAANDSRFHADVLLPQMLVDFDLDWLDILIYKYAIIPIAKKKLLELEKDSTWMSRPGFTEWGPGRDDALNLPKYNLVKMPYDNSIGNADFPAIRNLQARTKGALGWAGETINVHGFIIDSAVGVGAPADRRFMPRMRELQEYLIALPAAVYPFDIDATLAARGKPLYVEHCGSCHLPDGQYTGSVVPIDDIATDPGRLDTWTQEAADLTNKEINGMGYERPDMIKTHGYMAQILSGVWLNAPYLHNGSIPNLYELLLPVEQRSTYFYRGYDVYDKEKLGFISDNRAAQKAQYFDTTQRGNSNSGHEYGVSLGREDKRALLEYMKML